MSKKLIEVDAKAFDDLMYWLDRCSEKGHLKNCGDLVDPWAIFDANGWRVIEPTRPANFEYPASAIENGRILLDRVEQWYGFRDTQGHTIDNCQEWYQARQCFEFMAETLSTMRGAEHDQ